MEDLIEFSAEDLKNIQDTTCIVLYSDNQQVLGKIRLSELKKLLTDDLKTKVENVSKTANHADSFHRLIGPGSRYRF